MAGIKEINADTLRDWLENGQPVSVLDNSGQDWAVNPADIEVGGNRCAIS